ncbi:Phytocyanin domain-containing protein [Raphanus sativus]|nr:Phytocyanin domain-containing protein [Raphanus sativus]
MAACDTFRSGAVEQLRTHARRLQIPIFEKGYEKDPAVVAKEAIQEATRNGSDVVLVDTAGRMQDNEPLMRALSKLINLNKPDLVLFVGEALVGNDAVDQLSKFNQKLSDLSNSGTTRLIDGILLTKFDTIDDKVGAALSMVYISGAPVMFVGCGQSYTDLKKLNVKAIISNQGRVTSCLFELVERPRSSVWKYDAKVDSTEENYASCNTTKPLKQFNDGDTKLELKHSGASFFISGAPDHCVKGEKITLLVLSEQQYSWR